METYITRWVPAATTGEDIKEYLGGAIKVRGGEGHIETKYDALGAAMQTACNDLDKAGYNVISIQPMNKADGELGDVYTITAGVMITAKRKD